MADTVADEITELESRLTVIKAKIAESEQFRALEEGSSTGRFRTEFAEIGTLYKERDLIRNRLIVLKLGSV